MEVAPGHDPAAREVPVPDEREWRRLDDVIRSQWDAGLRTATERDIARSWSGPDIQAGPLALPFPYHAPFGDESPVMFAWDTDYINWGLLAHGRADLVRNHILNLLSMVLRYGFVPNASHSALTTRSQSSQWPDGLWRYYTTTRDRYVLELAYPLLKRNLVEHWNAPERQTPTGLTTNHDAGDHYWSPELSAEAETGLDWTPIYGGDVRRCVPLITNCALVRHAQVLALTANELGRPNEAAQFEEDADRRSELIRQYCWNEGTGLFLEYDFVAKSQLPYLSACNYWTLWSGVATPRQASELHDNLARFEQAYGISFTDKAYPDPHPETAYPQPADAPLSDVPSEMIGGQGWMQWMYPAGWAAEQLITVQGLDAYGFREAAQRVATRFLAVVLENYKKTGQLWEKYNVVDGTLVLPNSRYGNAPYSLSWTATAAVLLGRRVFLDQLFSESTAGAS
jgi:alpha,alpha-trehalase